MEIQQIRAYAESKGITVQAVMQSKKTEKIKLKTYTKFENKEIEVGEMLFVKVL